MEKRKIIGLLGFLFLLLALPLALLVMRQQVEYRGRATNNPSKPLSIRLTNLHDKGFTVSWITAEDTSGAISFYGINSSGTPVVINDLRGTGSYKTHYVDVFDGTNSISVNASTLYYFKIKSGTGEFGYQGTTDENTQFSDTNIPATPGGLHFRKTTAPTITYNENNTDGDSTLNTPGAYSTENGNFALCNQNTTPAKPHCFRPNPVWGQVFNSSNQAVEGAIVYMNVSGTNTTLSALTQGTTYAGKWVMDLANFRTTALTQYAAYTPFNESGKSSLTFTVQGGASGTKNLPGVDIPEVINIPASGTGSDCATVPANCLAPLLPSAGWTGTTDADKYIRIVLESASVTGTPTPTTGGPTATPTATGAPTPTATRVPTATPTTTGAPTATPTATGVPGATTLTFKINFQNIPTPTPGITMTLSNITVKRGTTNYFTNTTTVNSATNYFQGQITIPNSPQTASDYIVCVKGPQHLQKKFTGVTITQAQGNTLDKSSVANYLIVGDFVALANDPNPNVPDNKITMEDVSAILHYWTSSSVPATGELSRFDVIRTPALTDGYITMEDVSAVLYNWTSSTVLGDNCQ